MPRQPTAPPHTRIFGRLDKFDLECPACGTVIRVGIGNAPGHVDAGGRTQREALAAAAKRGALAKGVRSRQATAYNPLTSTLRCPIPACRAVYQVGIILWPSRLGRQGYLIPEDQRPTKAQLRMIRSYAKGFVAEQMKARGDATNVYVTAECTCPMTAGGWTPGCPVHGVDPGVWGAGGPAGEGKTFTQEAQPAGEDAPGDAIDDPDEGEVRNP